MAQIQLLITTMANNPLLYSNSYWQEKLGPKFRRDNLENKLHLIFSLLVFLEISLAQFLTFIFSSKIEKVKSRASCFMGYTETANDEDTCFPPSCHGPCSVTFFPKNNHRTAPTESPMMAASPLFSATITTSHLRRTYIRALSEYFLHSATTNKPAFLSLLGQLRTT